MEETRQKFVAFTDGSCNNLQSPHNGGWAFIVFKGNLFKPEIEEADYIESGGAINTTNNIMELAAIISLVKKIPEHSDVSIVTDSQYCIMVLDHRTKTFEKNMNFIECFRRTVENRDINYSFHWIKGHSGNKYNEFVDKLAVSEYMKLNNASANLEGFV